MEDFFIQIVESERQNDILEELKKESLPLVIWGNGSMSYSVRKILRHYEIEPVACWVDHADITEVDGMPVMSIEEIVKKYGAVNIVFGHSRYELADAISEKEGIHKCFCLINVCYEQWKHLTYEFVLTHKEEYERTYQWLEDDLSKKCLTAFLNCKLTEDFHYILPVYQEHISYFSNPFFEITESESLVDIGAYDGDMIRDFLKVRKCYERIYAIEPERESVNRLRAYISKTKLKNIDVYPYGCWNQNTELDFCEDQESSGVGSGGETKLKVYKLDDLLKNKKVSIIKINFLTGVCETLEGASGILKEQMPKLMIMAGFDEWGLIQIPQMIKAINSHYKIAIRYAAAMPARLILFAY